MGLLVRIENSSYITNNEMNSFHLESARYTDVKIDRLFKFILPRPYSNCDIDLTTHEPISSVTLDRMFFDPIARSEYLYTQEFCLNQCNQYLALKYCNCTDAFMLSQTKNQSCETKQQVECINEFANISILENYKFCFPFCPLQCNKTEYRTTLASVKLYGESFVDYINDNPNLKSDHPSTQIIDASLARERFIRLNIYYDSLTYTFLSETSKMDIVSLISFIGS